jgi:hypothetical protein
LQQVLDDASEQRVGRQAARTRPLRRDGRSGIGDQLEVHVRVRRHRFRVPTIRIDSSGRGQGERTGPEQFFVAPHRHSVTRRSLDGPPGRAPQDPDELVVVHLSGAEAGTGLVIRDQDLVPRPDDGNGCH